MSSAAVSLVSRVSPKDRLEVLFDEFAELSGQRNAIDGRLIDIIEEIDRDKLWGMTGARSMEALVAWKTGVTPRNAEVMVTVARRAEEFPRCTQALREGRLSLDRLGVLAEHAADGSDEHYIQTAEAATVTQLRTAVKLEPQPPKPQPAPKASITKRDHGDRATWTITLPKLDAATFDAALQSHRDALIHDRGAEDEAPFPTNLDAFMSLMEAGWDADAARRPHGQHTTVVVHVDVEKPSAALHLGPLLSDEDRRYLLCDATCEVWF
ncbi:DUF222 domain-containing protein, partial [Mycobacterium sp. 852013-51886_SCH5428379]|uniref:DUF222 domain-containing protein n=1 Tax=Mycobacterium sp. 852013-51886_SCH5428379 TaxID=1834111 RepID=UPI000AFF0293